MRTPIQTHQAPAAIGPYSQGIATDTMVFVSGQIPVDPTTGEIPEEIEGQTAQVLKNLKAVLEAGGASLDSVVKTTIFLTDLSYFETVNRLYGEAFTHPAPARSTIEVSKLPKGVLIEIEAIALKG